MPGPDPTSNQRWVAVEARVRQAAWKLLAALIREYPLCGAELAQVGKAYYACGGRYFTPENQSTDLMVAAQKWATEYGLMTARVVQLPDGDVSVDTPHVWFIDICYKLFNTLLRDKYGLPTNEWMTNECSLTGVEFEEYINEICNTETIMILPYTDDLDEYTDGLSRPKLKDSMPGYDPISNTYNARVGILTLDELNKRPQMPDITYYSNMYAKKEYLEWSMKLLTKYCEAVLTWEDEHEKVPERDERNEMRNFRWLTIYLKTAAEPSGTSRNIGGFSGKAERDDRTVERVLFGKESDARLLGIVKDRS